MRIQKSNYTNMQIPAGVMGFGDGGSGGAVTMVALERVAAVCVGSRKARAAPNAKADAERTGDAECDGGAEGKGRA